MAWHTIIFSYGLFLAVLLSFWIPRSDIIQEQYCGFDALIVKLFIKKKISTKTTLYIDYTFLMKKSQQNAPHSETIIWSHFQVRLGKSIGRLKIKNEQSCLF